MVVMEKEKRYVNCEAHSLLTHISVSCCMHIVH